MDMNMTLLGQLLVVHIVVAAACTAWYARRPSVHTTGSTLLVIFAWLVPLVGVMCLVVFLLGSRNREMSEGELT